VGMGGGGGGGGGGVVDLVHWWVGGMVPPAARGGAPRGRGRVRPLVRVEGRRVVLHRRRDRLGCHVKADADLAVLAPAVAVADDGGDRLLQGEPEIGEQLLRQGMRTAHPRALLPRAGGLPEA